MKIVRKHGLTGPEVRGVVEAILPTLATQYSSVVSNVSYAWEGDVLQFSLRSSGASLKGQTFVNDQEIVLDMGIPLRLKLFERMIRTELEGIMDQALYGPGKYGLL